MLYAKRPLMSDAMLRVFFEAYEIVADVLRDAPPDIGPEELTELALGLGRQFVAQGRVRSSEPVSTLLFATARQVAVDQELIAPAADLAERRVAFRRELRNILRDFDYVEQIARNQFVACEFKARQDATESKNVLGAWRCVDAMSQTAGHFPSAQKNRMRCAMPSDAAP